MYKIEACGKMVKIVCKNDEGSPFVIIVPQIGKAFEAFCGLKLCTGFS